MVSSRTLRRRKKVLAEELAQTRAEMELRYQGVPEEVIAEKRQAFQERIEAERKARNEKQQERRKLQHRQASSCLQANSKKRKEELYEAIEL